MSENQNFDYDWSILDLLINGKSAIDLPQLDIKTLDKAYDFVKGYGFDLNNNDDKESVLKLFNEAVDFIKLILIPEEWKAGLRPPQELFDLKDIAQLLLWASDSGKDLYKQKWSCSILRTMHTAAHLDSVWGKIDTAEVIAQLKKRFDPFIQSNDNNVILGNKTDYVTVNQIEWKPPKSRNSIFLKLLHKPGNVAESIYDLFGLRIVTDSIVDTIRVVQVLHKLNMISFPNTYPARSRNSLIDFGFYQSEIRKISKLDQAQRESQLQILNKQLELKFPQVDSEANPHTSSYYRALQFTARHMVRSRDNKQATYFFPLEIQIMDRKAFELSLDGNAAYAHYKLSQLNTVKKRILGSLLHQS